DWLPAGLAEQLKWLNYRAAEAAAALALGRAAEASDAALCGLVHALAVERAECPGLAAEPRALLRRMAWLALPALHGAAQASEL
ncbi:unnamed protein product, partial [Prorocentrum cordatum]